MGNLRTLPRRPALNFPVSTHLNRKFGKKLGDNGSVRPIQALLLGLSGTNERPRRRTKGKND
jgi:hypothetical protein